MDKSIMDYGKQLVTAYLVVVLIVLPLCGANPINLTAESVQDKINCVEKLNQAEESYYNGDLDQTIILVRECLQNAAISNDIKIRAYTILTRTYLSRNDLPMATTNVQEILKINPVYQPTIEEESPRFVNFVEEIKKEQVQSPVIKEKAGLTKWIWIGAGSVLTGAAVVIISSSSGNEEDKKVDSTLPMPPALP